MRVTLTDNQSSVIAIEGDLDTAAISELVWRAEECFCQGQYNLEIHMRGTLEISSSGLLALANIISRSKLHGGRAVLWVADPGLANLMYDAGFTTRFAIVDDSAKEKRCPRAASRTERM